MVERRGRFIAGFLAAARRLMVLLVPWLGRDFFPGIKSGEIDMHFRAPIGLRLEEAGKVAALVDTAVGTLLPGHVANVIDNCGLPSSGINQAYSASATIGPQDCDVTISLNDQASPVDEYRAILRDKLPKLFPGTDFTFPAGDITAKILNLACRRRSTCKSSGATSQRTWPTRSAWSPRCAASPASRMCRSNRRWRSRRCWSPRIAPSRSAPG